jgi:transcriptional regulator of acetoin/glycerol metabolism
MYYRKLLEQQINQAGLRLGDSCKIQPLQGKKKAFTLNRKCLDFISREYRPEGLSMSYIELPALYRESFHYRLETESAPGQEERYVLKTISGRPYWLNGLVAREAYLERSDQLYLGENKVQFNPFDLGAVVEKHFEHPILSEHKLMQSDLKVLIQGETGTGKTDLAQKIHQYSQRSGGFVAVNLSSFNPQLIESELFGHKKGAFTGAHHDKEGALALAEGGTLFLDEIDSLPVDLQTKLLTFIDNKKFRKVGDTKECRINTRLIFAAGTPLENLVQQGLFRRDFYYRLKSGFTVDLVALRNEPRKIKEGCQFYSLKYNVSLSERLLDFYLTLAWPGNFRQFFGHLDKKRILSRTTKLDFDQLDEELLLQSSDLLSLSEKADLVSMDEYKVQYAKKAFSMCEGNISMTAKKLALSEKTVRSLVSKISWPGCR